MSDFEQRMLARGTELKEAAIQTIEERRLANIEAERKRQEELSQVLKLGREVVALLQKYDIPTQAIWSSERKNLTEMVWHRNENDGWVVANYKHETESCGDPCVDYHRFAITTDGLPFRFHSIGAKNDPNGIVAGQLDYILKNPKPAMTEVLESQYFQDGVASLITTGKPFTEI